MGEWRLASLGRSGVREPVVGRLNENGEGRTSVTALSAGLCKHVLLACDCVCKPRGRLAVPKHKPEWENLNLTVDAFEGAPSLVSQRSV